MSFRDQGIEPADGFRGDGFTDGFRGDGFTVGFRGDGFTDGFRGDGFTDGFIVRPLLPSDVALDYDAVMSSREFLFHWEQEPPWPAEDFSIEENQRDLDQMHDQHQAGTRYTYTVMKPDESEVLGCVYLFPNDDRMYQTAKVTSYDGTDFAAYDALIAFWVRVDTWASGFERTLLDGLLRWIRDDWTITAPAIVTNEKLDHQIATIESSGLTRRFAYDRDKDLYTTYVYA